MPLLLVKRIEDFTDIALSMSALKKALKKQLNHSKANFLFAPDIELSRIFIKNLEDTLKSMEDLFGDTLKETALIIEITGGKDI